jgi:hypothetical protein
MQSPRSTALRNALSVTAHWRTFDSKTGPWNEPISQHWISRHGWRAWSIAPRKPL